MTILFSTFLQESSKDLTIDEVIERAMKHSAKNIPRSDMPQLTLENTDKILKYFADNNIKTTKERIDPSRLRFAQSNFHKEKVEKLLQDFTPVKNRIIYITKDGYVLDGNHRVLALILKKNKANVLRIHKSFSELVKILKNLSFIEFREEVE